MPEYLCPNTPFAPIMYEIQNAGINFFALIIFCPNTFLPSFFVGIPSNKIMPQYFLSEYLKIYAPIRKHLRKPDYHVIG
jgi:hypothetical protein